MVSPSSSALSPRVFRILVFCFLLVSPRAFAQWIQTHGPQEGYIYTFANLGDATFAGTFGGGVYRTTNKTSTWVAINNGLTNLQINSLAVIGTSLFAGTSEGLFRSQDQGDNWTHLSPSPQLSDANGLCVMGKGLMVDFGALGFFRTDDLGATWTKLNGNLVVSENYSCLDLGDRILVGRGDGVFVSHDRGDTWTPSSQGLNAINVSSLVMGGGVIYAGTDYGGVFVSRDSGATWIESNAGLTVKWTKALYARGDTVIVGVLQGGIFRSFNRGATWALANTGLGNINVHTLTAGGPYILAGTDAGVYRSTDMGTHWEPAVEGMVACYPSKLAKLGSNLFAATAGGEIHATKNMGANWTRSKSGFPEFYVFDIASFRGAIFAAGPQGLFRSTDSGFSWTHADSGLGSQYFYSFATLGRFIFASLFSSSGIYRSQDGFTWTLLGTDFLNRTVNTLAVCGSDLYMGTSGRGVFRSRDSGATWQPFRQGIDSSYIGPFAVSNGLVFVGADRGVYRRSQVDTTWIPINTGLPKAAVTALALQDSHLFAGTDSGLYQSDDSGKTWLNALGVLARPRITTLEIADGQLYAGIEDAGVWRRPLAEMTTEVRPFASRTQVRNDKSAHLTSSGKEIFYRRGVLHVIQIDGSEVRPPIGLR